MEEKNHKKSKIEILKYNYLLLFHPEKIKIPANLSNDEIEKFIRKVYRDKTKLHEKFGARKFQEIVRKFDQKKFQLFNKIKNRKRNNVIDKILLKFRKENKPTIIERITNYQEEKMLKNATTEEERQQIKENMIRSKNLIRKQIKEGKSINYYEGIDRRVEMFPEYLKLNKKKHQNALKKDIAVIGACIATGLIGIPFLPIAVGTYQVLAAIKDLQCINLQEYNLARIKTIEKKLVEKNMQKMQQQYNENQEAIESLQKAKKQGQNIYSIDGLIDSINNVEALKQLRNTFLEARGERVKRQKPQSETQYNTISFKRKMTEEELEEMILPKEIKEEKAKKVRRKK